MSKLPHAVTWIVCGPEPDAVAVCVEASLPPRINATIAQGGGPVRAVRVAYGQDYRGRWLDGNAERVLARSIYRRMKMEAPAVPPPVDPTAISRIVDAVCGLHGVARDEVLNIRIRRDVVKKARGQIVHELRRELGLTEKIISDILNFKNKSRVLYWLSVPYDSLSASSKEIE